MKITKLGVIAALVLGGLLAGSTTATAQEKKEGIGGGKRGFPTVEERLDRMTTDLKLTDEQKPKVKEVLEENNKKMQALQNAPQDERREKFREARDEMGKKLKPILTPEQYTKWEQTPRGGKKGEGKGGGEKKEGEKKN